jgi:hypothetical protein
MLSNRSGLPAGYCINFLQTEVQAADLPVNSFQIYREQSSQTLQEVLMCKVVAGSGRSVTFLFKQDWKHKKPLLLKEFQWTQTIFCTTKKSLRQVLTFRIRYTPVGIVTWLWAGSQGFRIYFQAGTRYSSTVPRPFPAPTLSPTVMGTTWLHQGFEWVGGGRGL